MNGSGILGTVGNLADSFLGFGKKRGRPRKHSKKGGALIYPEEGLEVGWPERSMVLGGNLQNHVIAGKKRKSRKHHRKAGSAHTIAGSHTIAGARKRKSRKSASKKHSMGGKRKSRKLASKKHSMGGRRKGKPSLAALKKRLLKIAHSL